MACTDSLWAKKRRQQGTADLLLTFVSRSYRGVSSLCRLPHPLYASIGTTDMECLDEWVYSLWALCGRVCGRACMHVYLGARVYVHVEAWVCACGGMCGGHC